jgi:hypothetical protein
MQMGATAAALIAASGAAQRLPPAHTGTRPSAVHIAVITLPTELHRCVAAATLKKPIGLFVVEHAGATLYWTTPCRAGIKVERKRLYPRRSVEGPGF